MSSEGKTQSQSLSQTQPGQESSNININQNQPNFDESVPISNINKQTKWITILTKVIGLMFGMLSSFTPRLLVHFIKSEKHFIFKKIVFYLNSFNIILILWSFADTKNWRKLVMIFVIIIWSGVIVYNLFYRNILNPYNLQKDIDLYTFIGVTILDFIGTVVVYLYVMTLAEITFERLSNKFKAKFGPNVYVQ